MAINPSKVKFGSSTYTLIVIESNPCYHSGWESQTPELFISFNINFGREWHKTTPPSQKNIRQGYGCPGQVLKYIVKVTENSSNNKPHCWNCSKSKLGLVNANFHDKSAVNSTNSNIFCYLTTHDPRGPKLERWADKMREIGAMLGWPTPTPLNLVCVLCQSA